MASAKELKTAKVVYETLCETLDERNWKYTRHDDDLVVSFGVSGDDLPMNMIMICDADYQLVRLLSPLSFKIPDDHRVELALATCHVNFKLADGSFDMDLGDGEILFRLTSSFRESLISKDMLNYMINVSCATIDEYNDKFLMISKGALSIQDFMTKE